MADSPARAATRIVSLVPSVTESLFCLGLGERVVGITDWCVHPSVRVSGLPRVGGANVFADCGDRHYPIVELEQIVAAAPEVILLPSEPYDFGPRDALELAALTLPAARSGRIHWIDGTLVSWYGPRIELAITTIRALFSD